MKILITYAVQGEFVEVKFPGMRGDDEVLVGYLRTGIGKVKSAYYLTDAINRLAPDMVINMGTAGTTNHHVGDIFLCRRFVDRDMQRVKDLGVEYAIDTSAMLEAKGYCCRWQGAEGVCNTGDSFLTERTDVEGDVVDMEAYAQAWACQVKGIPFIAIKYVTDVIGQNSIKHWEDKLADARQALEAFFAQTGGI